MSKRHRVGNGLKKLLINLFVLIIGVGLAYAIFVPAAEPPPRPPPPDLVVFLDVSMSQTVEDIQSGVTRAFQYIASRHLPDESRYRVYVADRDVARNLIGKGEKLKATGSAEIEKQRQALLEDERAVSKEIDAYIQRNPQRNRTCLVQALNTAPSLFAGANRDNDLRILFVSDMIEDCSDTPEPRDEAQLRAELKTSVKQTALTDLKGLQVIAVVPTTQDTLTVASLRHAWDDLLAETGRRSFTLDTLAQIVRLQDHP